MSANVTSESATADTNVITIDVGPALDDCLKKYGFTWKMPEIRERLGGKVVEALPDLLKKVITRSVILSAISEHSNAERARIKTLGRMPKSGVKTSEAPPPASGEREDSSSMSDLTSPVHAAHAGQEKKSITP